MQSGPATAASAPLSDAPTMADGAAAWSALCAKLQQRAALDAQIVELTGEVQRSGTIEALEGVPLDTALNLVHRLPAAERGVMLTAADVLSAMPATMRLLRERVLSWGQVRQIVAEAKCLSREQQAVLDAYISASQDMFAKLDPDDAVDAVRIVVAELRGLAKTEQAQQRDERSSFLWAQPAMFGRGKLYSEMDNLTLATVLNGVDAMAPPDDGRSLAQRRVEGLRELALLRVDGPDGPAVAADAEGDADAIGEDTAAPAMRPTRHPRLRSAVPSVDVVVDMSQVTVTAAGVIQVNAPGCLPTLTARAVEALSGDAAVRVVLMDGGRPLAATAKVEAKTVPTDTRAAVLVRDRGCRFPGSRAPRGQVHVHHVDRQRRGHHPDALISLAEAKHRLVHRAGWAITIHGNGEATFTRGDRSWTTLPRGTRLRGPAPEAGDDAPPT